MMRALLALLLLACALPAWGQVICYVLDGGTATGSNGCSTNGGSWNQAYDQLTTAETNAPRGATIYVADGTYNGVTFNTAASGGQLITIKRATASDHGTETGWNSAFGDGLCGQGTLNNCAVFTSTMAFSTSDWRLNGQTGGGPGSWKTGFGFRFKVTNGPALRAPASNPGTTLSNVVVSHVEIEGAGDDQAGTLNDGIATFPNRITSSTFEYLYIHDMGRCIYFLTGQNDIIIQYNYTGKYEAYDDQGPGPDEHSELASVWAASGNIDVRWNIFTFSVGTGSWVNDNSGNHAWQTRIYGNIFWRDNSLSGQGNGENGLITGWTGGQGEDMYNYRVVNNTFYQITGGSMTILGTTSQDSGDNLAQNNLFVDVSAPKGGSPDWATITHNHFSNSGSSIGTNATTGTVTFVDAVNLNFTPTAATPAGTNLGAPYNVDMLGNVRGADGTWDRGALEFGTAVLLPKPGNLHVR